MTEEELGPEAVLADRAEPLDSLLVQAALGPVRRLAPDGSVARLVQRLAGRPVGTGRRLVRLGAESLRIAVGASELAASPRDRRFEEPGWSDNPALKRTLQLYLATHRTAQELLADADLEWRDHARVSFLLENLAQALAPSNLPLLNPASAKAAIDTGGLSLLRGGSQLVKDLAAPPRVPQMVDESPFEVGRNIAVTPGSVVFRNDVLELIQYHPDGSEVYEVPLLIVPPTINKYYAIDLSPGRSLVEHSVGHGRQLFVISWRNPDARHADWGFETYIDAILEALAAVERITGITQTVLGGICSGGILAAITAGYLAGTGGLGRVAAMCLAVTVIDSSRAGTTGALVSRRAAEAAKATSRRQGYLDGRALAEVFAWLRPGDLIWNYWVNNYLLGKRPPAFDILFWNADTTRMTAQLHADFVDLSLDNLLTTPGAVSIHGVPIDLGAVDVDSYVLAGIADHLTPWQSCYSTTQLLGGQSRFVLSSSGHIAALVNPPSNPRASFQVNPDTSVSADEWLAGAETRQGSWWNDVSEWLDDRFPARRPAPSAPGAPGLPVLAAAGHLCLRPLRRARLTWATTCETCSATAVAKRCAASHSWAIGSGSRCVAGRAPVPRCWCATGSGQAWTSSTRSSRTSTPPSRSCGSTYPVWVAPVRHWCPTASPAWPGSSVG